ncbi:hypothetical protein [Leeuwenhoekiella sp. ZYFB001]|uniref:hypothetical protein n=1 Tax=Leeuwenhoekiella sp. ZYFB001 TaxID=2719912 RepID=UPI001430BC6C|nr:hypothetical protein [Leeuwenhoekiella sp. ZYFB001]
MYTINNIAFETYGITSGRIDGSNIALSGQLDMPARLGKTFHDWTGEEGVEPYVLASEIRHGGRDLVFSGYVVATTKELAYTRLAEFYDAVKAYDDLVTLATPYGSFEVYINDQIEAEHLQLGWLSIRITFREPVINFGANLLSGTESAAYHIDGVSLKVLGAFVTRLNDNLSLPKPKAQNVTFYQTESYQITPASAHEFEAVLVFYADSYAQLAQHMQQLHKLLAAPGMRLINIDGIPRECFNIKGVEVRNIKVASDFAMCEVTVPLMSKQTGKPLETGYLLDNEYNNIVTNLYELIKIYA